jgi:phage terminase small subunit
MKNLTAKQQAFVANKVAGCTNRDAAISAGYSVTAASSTADKLMAMPAIRAAIKRAPGVDTKSAPPALLRGKYKDSMALLIDAMNCDKLPIGARIDCAKALLPYQHARMGETGKKEKAKDRAREIARSGRNKFATKQPPQLHLVKD